MEMSQEDDDSDDTTDLAALEAEEFITAESSVVNLNSETTPPAVSVIGNGTACHPATGVRKSSLRVTARNSALAASAASESEYNL